MVCVLLLETSTYTMRPLGYTPEIMKKLKVQRWACSAKEGVLMNVIATSAALAETPEIRV